MPTKKAVSPVDGRISRPISRPSSAPACRTGRLAIHIGASVQAAGSVNRLLCAAGSVFNASTLSRRERKDGSIGLVVECDARGGVERLLFQIEKIPGAAVEECTIA